MTTRTIEAARGKIAQLQDAHDEGDLLHLRGAASGWIAALRLEGLIDEPTFRELSKELDDAHWSAAGASARRWRAALEVSATEPLTLPASFDEAGLETLRLALVERRKLADDAPDADALLARALLEAVGRDVLRAACRAAQIDWPELQAD